MAPTVSAKVGEEPVRIMEEFLNGCETFINWKYSKPKLVIALLISLTNSSASAQNLTVTIINRQDNETDYTYFVPWGKSAPSV
jgi:hypothetical protein